MLKRNYQQNQPLHLRVGDETKAKPGLQELSSHSPGPVVKHDKQLGSHTIQYFNENHHLT